MKKCILLLSMITLSGFATAQVGILTPNPQGSFHVDGAKDNAAVGVPTSAQQANDFIVTSTGNVGIGTTTPSSKLDLGTSAGKKLAIWNNAAGNDFYGLGAATNSLQLFSGVPNTGSALMTLTKNGRVGISTEAPQHTLHSIGTLRFEGVNAGQAAGMVLTATDNLGTAAWRALPTSTDTSIYLGNGTISGTNTTRIVAQATNNLSFTSTATTGTSHFTVDGNTFNIDAVNNRVGMGTSSPSSSLHVVSKDLNVTVIEQANSSVSSGGPYLALRKNQSDNPAVNSAVTAGASIGAITFDGNTGNGYTGSGIASKPSVSAYALENFSPTSKGAMLAFSTVPMGSINAQRRMTIGPDGKVGIGRGAITNILEIEGNASKTTAGSWLGNSDARLKKDIKQISSEEALEKLLKLKGVYYYWNDDKTGIARPKEKQIGFVAQNIQDVFPDKVSTDKNGYLQTAYGDYDAILVEAIRALTEKNKNLENKINELETKINNL